MLAKRWVSHILVTLGLAASGWLILWFGGMNWLLADDHPIRNILEGLSWPTTVLAFFVALPFVQRRMEQRKEIPRDGNSILQGRALHLDESGRIPRVRDVGLLQMRVSRAIDTYDEHGTELPVYVRRDIDISVTKSITDGGIVLLHGQAAAGKSRAAGEALSRSFPERHFLMPVDGRALREIVESGYSFANTVVWLDDLERYLTRDGLNLPLLQRICPANAHGVSIVATIRSHHLVAFRAHDKADRSATELIASIPPARTIRVNRALTYSEEDRARQSRSDERIVQALESSSGFAEYLAAGPEMLRRWSEGDGALFHLGQAVISAAVDCRRAGFFDPVPEAVLASLTHHYLAVGWRDRADYPPIRRALDWACEPVLGASSCLHRDSKGKLIAADYLVDHIETGGDGPLSEIPTPQATWNTLLDIADTVDAFLIGISAFWSMEFSVAIKSMGEVVGSVEPESDIDVGLAYFVLGVSARNLNRYSDAENWLLQGIEKGNEASRASLASLLDLLDREDEAEYVYRCAVEHRAPEARCNLAGFLGASGRDEEAEFWYRRAVEISEDESLSELGRHLIYSGRDEDAEYFLRRAVDCGERSAKTILATLMNQSNNPEEAERLLREAIEDGGIDSQKSLGEFLHLSGRLEEAEYWLRSAAESREPGAQRRLGDLLCATERKEQAIEWYRKEDESGGKSNFPAMVVALLALNRIEEALEWAEYSVTEKRMKDTLSQVGMAFQIRGQFEKAEYWLRWGVQHDQPFSYVPLAQVLRELGNIEESDYWYQSAAEGDKPDGKKEYGKLLHEKGNMEEAELWLQIASKDDEDSLRILNNIRSERST